MKTILLTALTVILVPVASTAQYYFYNQKYYQGIVEFELGGGVGAMNALTDLGGKKGDGKNSLKDLTWKTARPCFGLYSVATYKNAIGVKFEITAGSVTGYDSILKRHAASAPGRYERNLSFKTSIIECALGFEAHPLFIFPFDDDHPPIISPYLIAGIGYYMFNPKANLNGNWFALANLKTEGQGFAEYPERKRYSLQQFNFSFGAGIKYEIKPSLNLRVEWVHRILHTDYLDDVSKDYVDPALFSKYLPVNAAHVASQLYNRKIEVNPSAQTKPGDQRGDQNDNDAFFTLQLKLGIVIGRQKR